MRLTILQLIRLVLNNAAIIQGKARLSGKLIFYLFLSFVKGVKFVRPDILM